MHLGLANCVQIGCLAHVHMHSTVALMDSWVVLLLVVLAY